MDFGHFYMEKRDLKHTINIPSFEEISIFVGDVVQGAAGGLGAGVRRGRHGHHPADGGVPRQGVGLRREEPGAFNLKKMDAALKFLSDCS